MTDYFALLQEERRPWLDPETLKQKFLAVSARSHPDRVHGGTEAEKAAAQDRYAELNAAYTRLREPKERLQHLLELERGAPPGQVQRIPADLMDLSMQVAQLCRRADALLEEKVRTSSPLLAVRLFEESQHCSEQLTALREQIARRQEALTAELQRLDSEWGSGNTSESSARPALLARLEELYRLFSYFGRWGGQLQERAVRLSF